MLAKAERSRKIERQRKQIVKEIKEIFLQDPAIDYHWGQAKMIDITTGPVNLMVSI